MPYRFRFTIGQLMGVVALSAAYLAAGIYSMGGRYTPFMILFRITGVCGLGVMLYNRRVSGWMWAMIVGYGAPTVLGFVVSLLAALLPITAGNDVMTVIQLTVASAGSLLFVVGLALTFRDVRRRLAIREGGLTSDSSDPRSPPFS